MIDDPNPNSPNLPCSIPLIRELTALLLFCFITDMPSEKATVLSKFLKISRKRNLLSQILELKVMNIIV